jgi:cytochrome c oxidase subunit IV
MSDSAHEGLEPKQYWLLALVLAVITAVEVGILEVEAFEPVKVPLLIGLSLVKFAAVVALFMHLKFGTTVQKTVFLIGLGGAVVLFSVVLLVSGAF